MAGRKSRDEKQNAVLLRVSQNIRRLRQDRAWTQREMAKHSGLSQARISILERGVEDLRITTLTHLVEVLGATIEDLFQQAPLTLEPLSPPDPQTNM